MALKASGIVVKKLATPYIHSKAVIADGVVGYVGSANLTQNSVDSNREIGLMIEGPALATLAATVDVDYKAGVAY
jgi:phosphatidylserine/phosphatidylglycerophosphate/cardiolipin synthase-like enzyme